MLVALLFLSEQSINVSPWAQKTHQQIANDALQYLQADLRSLLERNIARYLEGAVAPDTQFKDFVNHVWHVDESYGNGVNKIAEEVEQIKQKVKQNSKEADIAFEFGVISHYITDLNNPLHTSGKDPNEENYHTKFEDYADTLLPVKYTFDGAANVTDIRQRMRETANWAYQYYDTIKTFYQTSPGDSGWKYCGSKKSDVYHYPWCQYVAQIKPENLIWFKDEYDAYIKGYRPCKVCNPPAYTGPPSVDQSKLNAAIQACYSHAVNDVVDIFHTTWLVSKKKSKSVITLLAFKEIVRIGEEITIDGFLEPKRAGLAVSILESTDGVFFYRTSFNPATDSKGQFSVKLRPESAGFLYLKASWAGDMDYNGSDSNILVICCLKKASSLIVSIANPSLVVYSLQTISGVLDPRIAGTTVTITWIRPDGSRFNSTAKTASDGAFSSAIETDSVGEWGIIASWRGNDFYEGNTSSKMEFRVVKMRLNITISTSSEPVIVGDPIRISGALSPKSASVVVRINYTKPNGAKITRDMMTDSGGDFQDSVSTDSTGSWKVEASYAGDSVRESAASTALLIEVKPSVSSLIIGLAILGTLVVVIAMVWRRLRPSTPAPPPNR